MLPDVSAIVVNHRTASDALRCVASLAEAFREEGISGEVVLVDCGSGGEEPRRLEAAQADVLVPLAENRGYAGGVNAGLARARSARLVISNADVLFRPGALAPLLETIDEVAVGAAAPLAFWDSTERLRLPAGWSPGFWSDLAQRTGRAGAPHDRRFASFARDAIRLWESGGRARHLSGAVLAVRREVFDRVGRFDERFPLEYEETEWEDRLRARRLELRFVPRSRVIHFWGGSAASTPEAAQRKLESRRLYWRRRYGALGRALLERAAPRSGAPSFPGIREPRFAARRGAWIAVSTNPSILPFAGAPLEEEFALPDEIAARSSGRPLFFRVFRAADGEPLETGVWVGG